MPVSFARTVLPQRGVRRFGLPRLSSTDRPVIIQTGGPSNPVWRVLLTRKVTRIERGGVTNLRVEDYYLDGGHRVTLYNENSAHVIMKEDTVANAALPIKTNNIADFGRMDEAIVGFLTILDKIEGEPSEDQQELILQTYQGLLAWIENARRQVQDSEAKLDLVSAKVRSMLIA